MHEKAPDLRPEIIHEHKPRTTTVVPGRDTYVIPRSVLIRILEESLSTEVGPNDSISIRFLSDEERQLMDDERDLAKRRRDEFAALPESMRQSADRFIAGFDDRRDGLHVVITRAT